jgi:hypothetical protein
MADTKISALPASTTPLAGTEVLPIVQSSSTKQVSVANLTAGRSFDALGMTLTSTDAGAAAAPILDLYRDSTSPAASDTLGEIEFNGEDSAGNKQAYGLIHASILSPTSTAEQGQLHFETATAGALTEKMIIGTTNLVINEIGAVFNVRIEGDTDANLFFTDATNDKVGVGTASPAEKLDVVGKIKLSDNLVIGTSGKGIDFSATPGTGTSELLADYEEGTWTPTIGGNNEGTGGGAGNVYSTQVGTYVKVGKVVTCNCNVYLSTASGNSGGVIFINNFPFPANATTNSLPYASISWDGLSSSYVNVMGYLNNNASRMHLIGITGAATSNQTFIAPSQLTNTSGFAVTFTYITT